MSINRVRDAQGRARFQFEFCRSSGDRRIRTRKLLPAAWTRDQAEKFDRKESARLYAQASGIESRRWTIDQAVTRYLDERAVNLKTHDGLVGELAGMVAYYKGRPIEELPEVAAEYTADHRAELAPATIRNRLRYLSAACRWGWKRHNMCEHDPAARVVMPAVSNEKKIFLDRRQMLRLARNCASRKVRAMIRISFYSGMRLDEIRRARIEGDCWVLDDTKNGEPRIIPMHPRCRAYSSFKWPSKGWVAQCLREATAATKGLPAGVTFHTMRHSSASAMLKEGVDLHTVGAVLGHKSGASTRRYAHLATEALKNAVGQIGRRATFTPSASASKAATVVVLPMEARPGVEPGSTDLQSTERTRRKAGS